MIDEQAPAGDVHAGAFPRACRVVKGHYGGVAHVTGAGEAVRAWGPPAGRRARPPDA